ncbi:MAG: hypothetical protein IJ571_08865 [Ruminococcus sp.]|nr:hypothetical protein [Ruminococcus sp.]
MKKAIVLAVSVMLLAGCTDMSSDSSSRKEKKKPAIRAVSSAESSEAQTSADITDGDYPILYNLPLSQDDPPEFAEVIMEVYSPTGYSSLDNGLGSDVMSSGVVGLVGCPVIVDLQGSDAVLSFVINREYLGNVPFENLMVLKSGHGLSYDAVEFRVDGDIIRCDIDESDTYMLVDSYQWLSCWGEDVSGTEHDTDFTVSDYSFKLTLPSGVAPSGVSDYWHDEYDGYQKMMVQELMHQNQKKDSHIKAELHAKRYPNAEDDCDDPTPLKSFDEKIEEIKGITGDTFEIESTEVWKLDDNRKGFYDVFHFYGQPDLGIDEQTNVDAYYEYSDDTYIVFSLSFTGHDQSDIDACVNSVKSFRYF